MKARGYQMKVSKKRRVSKKVLSIYFYFGKSRSAEKLKVVIFARKTLFLLKIEAVHVWENPKKSKGGSKGLPLLLLLQTENFWFSARLEPTYSLLLRSGSEKLLELNKAE